MDFLFSRLAGWESGRNKVKVHTPMEGQTKNPTNVGLRGNIPYVIYICHYVIYFLHYNNELIRKRMC